LRNFAKINHSEKRFLKSENSFARRIIGSVVGEHSQTSKDLVRKYFTECFEEQGKAKGECI